MSLNLNFSREALALLIVVSAGCGDDIPPPTECGAGTMLVGGECVSDSACGAGTTLTNGMCLPTVVPPVTTYRQVEHLGRPGIAEALLLSNGFLDAYNQTAPFFTGVPMGDLNMVVDEAKTVLRALFYGTCLLNGVAGFTDPAMAAKPGGVQCPALGTAIFTENTAAGVMLTAAMVAEATVYANRVFDQFVPDVLRIDTVPTSAYLTLCGAAATGQPLLCGGRNLRDDVIDTTYFYLVSGAAVPTGAVLPATVTQVVALVTDGVYFSSAAGENVGTLGTPDPSNLNQFKQNCANCDDPRVAISASFPYSAAPH